MTTLAAEQVAPGVWMLHLPIPDGYLLRVVNVFAIEDDEGGVHLVDAGWGTEAAWTALVEQLGGLHRDIADVRSVTLTHHHEDHRGLANRIREASGANVAMHRADVAAQATPRAASDEELRALGVPEQTRRVLIESEPPVSTPTKVDQALEDGDDLAIPGRRVVVVHTPGHSLGSICLAMPDEELLFLGDHILTDISPGVGLIPGRDGQDALTTYLESLRRISPMREWRGLPGHGAVIDQLGARVDAIAQHQLRRGDAARAKRAEFPGASIWEIASMLQWGPGWDGLKPWHRVSALRQTAMHIAHSGQAAN